MEGAESAVPNLTGRESVSRIDLGPFVGQYECPEPG